MNLTKLKAYAPRARQDFIQAVTDRTAFYGIKLEGTAVVALPIATKGDGVVIGGRVFPKKIVAQRAALEKRIGEFGFAQTMEALAYTWFNRLVAIRYMEVHGYLDHGYRILSPSPHGVERAERQPEILGHAEHVEWRGLSKQTIIDLKLDGTKDSELYKLLLLAQCHALHATMPFIFPRLDDETELVLPDNLLHSDSLIRKLASEITDEDCANVEVLGWLYQFYMSERKDQVMARKSAVPMEDIPAVTQLFTPHWIVRYLIENSLGRLWLRNRPSSRLREHMPYYIEGEPEADFLTITKPEEIRLCDPAVGSGHMLTYAFDLLTLIYEEEGYEPTEIPALILRHNLQGLEICPRAAQLAELALVFKAREKSRRFFQSEHLVRPHIIELRNVRFAEGELRDYIHAVGLGDLFNQPMLKLLHQFEEAKNFGSLIQPCLDEPAIAFVRRAIEAKDLSGQLFLRETHIKVLRVLEQAEALTQRYQVVVANPPYLGIRQTNASIKIHADNLYPQSKPDLYSMFIERCLIAVVPNGTVGMVTMQSWMFLTSFEAFRTHLFGLSHFSSMAHLGPRAFDTISGEVVQTTAFVLIKSTDLDRTAVYLDATSGINEAAKERLVLERLKLFKATLRDISQIPGKAVAYWASPRLRRLFTELKPLSSVAQPRQGMATSDNARFLRYWHEVSSNNIALGCLGHEDSKARSEKWYPYNKGGSFRRWSGNNDYVVNWQHGGEELKAFVEELNKLHPGGRLKNQEFYFRENLTYNALAGGDFSCRHNPPGFLFDTKGSCIFIEQRLIWNLLGYLNSRVCQALLDVLCPTLDYSSIGLNNTPYQADKNGEELVKAAVTLAAADWNNFETSWDFRDSPLLRPVLKGATLEASWRNWEAQSTAAIRRMQELETENNRLFITAYGLDGELQPEVPEAQITLARAEARRDVAAFLSYAVGCVMGRYSPDHPGLILANAGDTLRAFLAKVGRPQDQLTFAPDGDGIIPVLDAERFEDDVVARVRAFLRAAFGDATLDENVRFIESALGKNLRQYFLTDFYKDHLKTYKKRPIYWLFSSGKGRAFQCLVYLHRYNESTLARMRTEYVIPLQGQIDSRIEQLEGDKAKATATSTRKGLQREQDTLKKQQAEILKFDEQLKHAADKRVALDLDDGVKVNYGKFGDLLTEVAAVTGGSDE